MAATELDGRKVRAAERREEMRERLLAAALEVFAEQGFQAGTTKAITQRAGVAEGLLFHYFPTKTDLMLAVLARDPLEPAIRQLIEEAGAVPVREALPRMARQWLAVLRAHQPVALVLLQHAHADPQVQAAIVQAVERIVGVLVSYFAARVAAGELRGFAPDAAASLVLQALSSLAITWDDRPVAECERLLDHQIDLLLHGMVPSDRP
jgi:AcrR family transcriptional regulator